jgi:hypothetical protein
MSFFLKIIQSDMEKGWKEVFLTVHEYQAYIARDLLREAGIPVVIMNRRDSPYQTFGEFAVVVPGETEETANDLLKELKN